MKKSITIIMFLVLFYALPLIVRPELILSPKIIILMIICATLFYTQPTASIREAEKMKSTDKHSMFGILIATALSQIIAVTDWAYFQDNLASESNFILTSIALVLMISGSAFRIWSILTLGKFFTATVQVKRDQRIIKTGPYVIVRHPSYLGAYIAIVGSAIFLRSTLALIVGATAMWLAYRVRIAVEEEVLLNAFGDEYGMYQRHTRKMIPYVW